MGFFSAIFFFFFVTFFMRIKIYFVIKICVFVLEDVGSEVLLGASLLLVLLELRQKPEFREDHRVIMVKICQKNPIYDLSIWMNL